MDTLKEWAEFIGLEVLQVVIGCAWIVVMLSFIGFILCYLKYYRKGVKENNKAYLYAYREMEKFARQVVGGFLIFIMMSIAASQIDGFATTLAKGGVLALLVVPAAYFHYGDENKFYFSTLGS